MTSPTNVALGYGKHTHTHTHTRLYAHTPEHASMQLNMHADTHTHTHTHMHTHSSFPGREVFLSPFISLPPALSASNLSTSQPFSLISLSPPTSLDVRKREKE